MNNPLEIGPLQFLLFMVGCAVFVAIYAAIVVYFDERARRLERDDHIQYLREPDEAWDAANIAAWDEQMR